jgi:hypothetical protein
MDDIRIGVQGHILTGAHALAPGFLAVGGVCPGTTATGRPSRPATWA